MGTFQDLEKQLTADQLTTIGGPADQVDAWKKQYLQPKFRGVEFFVKSARNSGGRRLSIHEYPNKDQIGYEDLGAKGKRFTFAAYVLGADYFTQRENLIAALDTPGPGKLVHPYRGIFDVLIEDWEEIEKVEEGRVARFSITAVVYTEQSLTVVSANPQAQTFEKKENMLDNILAEFEAAYNIAQMPVTGVQDALSAIDNFFEVVQAAKKVVYSVSDFQRELSQMKGKAVQLVLEAAGLANYLTSLVDYGTGLDADSALDQLTELAEMYEKITTNNTKTPDNIYFAEDYPATQINNVVLQTVVASSLGLITNINYETLTQAENVKLNVLPQLDFILNSSNPPDTVYSDYRDTKAATVSFLETTVLELARVEILELTETTNVLALCHEVYGNIDIETQQEILDRNEINNPAAISGNIQVVFNA